MTSIYKKSLILQSRTTQPLFNYTQQQIQIHKDDIVIKNICFSIDPVMTVWLSGAKSNFRVTNIGEVFNCFGVGKVIQGNESYPVGAYIFGNLGTSNYTIFDEKRSIQCFMVPKQLVEMYGPKKFLYYINNGLAAYSGYQILDPKPDQTVVVSTASGATGLILCQLLKKKKVKSVGLTSKDKMQKLKNHADVVANYKDRKQLVKVLKENKFSYYFDNVGEELLDLILLHIKTNGRIALCGAIANYSNHSGRGIKNIGIAISKRLKLQGINFSELMPRAIQIFKHFQGLDLPLTQIQMPEFEKHFSEIIKSGNKIIGKVIVNLQ